MISSCKMIRGKYYKNLPVNNRAIVAAMVRSRPQSFNRIISPRARRWARWQLNRWARNIRKRKGGSVVLSGHANKKRLLWIVKDKKKKYTRVVGNAAGTTRTTSRMIVRRTPPQQRFLRKLFKDGEHHHQKHVQRFGFSFVGAFQNNEAIWYSVTHLKFNNICDFLYYKIKNPNQLIGTSWIVPESTNADTNISLNPDQFIYLGKCTFNYELYNPTNYNMTVYIYDLICKHDTPYQIQYGSTQTTSTSSSPEVCMQQSTTYMRNANEWMVSDPTFELANPNTDPASNPDWRTVGMKPTDYYYFNSMWKVKGMKKLILPPQTSHHHVVIFNPKTKISLGNWFYRYKRHEASDKHGVAGLTQSTLFGIEGQVATEKDQETDNEKVGTLPGKLVIKCIRKCNVYSFLSNTSTIISKNHLQPIPNPEIFTDLVEQPASVV